MPSIPAATELKSSGSMSGRLPAAVFLLSYYLWLLPLGRV